MSNGSVKTQQRTSDENETKSGIESLTDAFGRMEAEVVGLKGALVSRMEYAIENCSNMNKPSDLEKKIDTLVELLQKNNDNQREVKMSLDNVSKRLEEHDSKIITEDHINKITSDLKEGLNISNLKRSVEDIKESMIKDKTLEILQKEVTEVVGKVNEMKEETKAVKDSIREMKEEVLDKSAATNVEIQQLRKNSDDSLNIFRAIKDSLSNIENKDILISTTKDKDKKGNISPEKDKHTNNITEIQTRKGIMFSSSIALKADKNRLEDELCCDLTMVPTYHIERHGEAKDPELFLSNMIKQHIKEDDCEYDFVIISVGSNDVTALDPSESPNTTMFNEVQNQMNTLVKAAEELASNQMDVFVNMQPPR